MKFPEKCPYCGKDNTTNKANCTSPSVLNKFESIFVETHLCVHCHQPIFVLYKSNSQGREILEYLPISQYVSFPPNVRILSPNSYEMFVQATRAKEMGMTQLALIGLRVSLEWLALDYIVKIKRLNEEEYAHKRLYEKIKIANFQKDDNTCARVLRKLGNENAHIVKKLDFTIEEAFCAFDVLLTSVEKELKVKNFEERCPSNEDNISVKIPARNGSKINHNMSTEDVTEFQQNQQHVENKNKASTQN